MVVYTAYTEDPGFIDRCTDSQLKVLLTNGLNLKVNRGAKTESMKADLLGQMQATKFMFQTVTGTTKVADLDSDDEFSSGPADPLAALKVRIPDMNRLSMGARSSSSSGSVPPPTTAIPAVPPPIVPVFPVPPSAEARLAALEALLGASNAGSNARDEATDEVEEGDIATRDPRLVPTAPGVISGLLREGRTFTQYVSRNKHEAVGLASVLDSLLKEGIDSSSLGVEKLVRRITGLQYADASGNCHVMQAFEMGAGADTLISAKVLKDTLSLAASLKKLEGRGEFRSSGGRNYSGNSSSYGRGGGQFNRSNFPSRGGGNTVYNNSNSTRGGRGGYGNNNSNSSGRGLAPAGGAGQQ